MKCKKLYQEKDSTKLVDNTKKEMVLKSRTICHWYRETFLLNDVTFLLGLRWIPFSRTQIHKYKCRVNPLNPMNASVI